MPTIPLNVSDYDILRYNPSWEASSDIIQQLVKVVDRTAISINTPGYDSIIASGGIVNNPFLLTDRRLSCEPYSFTATSKTTSDFYTLTGGSISKYRSSEGLDFEDLTIYDDSDLLRTVKLQALAKMNSAPFSFGEDIGEFKQTLKFLKQPITSIFDLTLSMLKKNRKNIRKGLTPAKAMADAYATYQWAFKPLVRSANDLAIALASWPPEYPPRESSRGKVVEKNVLDLSQTIGSTDFIASREVSTEVRASLLYSNASAPDMMRKYGLRLRDAPVTAWQLFPLSFMIDRVTNISNVIDATVNYLDPDLNVLAGSTVVRRTVTTKYRADSETAESWNVTISGGLVKDETFTYDRKVWKPELSDLVPPFKPARLVKDAQSILDLTSLLVQRLP